MSEDRDILPRPTKLCAHWGVWRALRAVLYSGVFSQQAATASTGLDSLPLKLHDLAVANSGSVARVSGPRARDVVGHGEREQNEQPEDGGDDGDHRELGAVAQVHKEEYDQRAFDGGNQQR